MKFCFVFVSFSFEMGFISLKSVVNEKIFFKFIFKIQFGREGGNQTSCRLTLLGKKPFQILIPIYFPQMKIVKPF